jgi:hypothetical protein
MILLTLEQAIIRETTTKKTIPGCRRLRRRRRYGFGFIVVRDLSM